MPAAPRVLIVGPVTIDLIEGQRTPGGAVAYAARTAAAMGVRASILTVAGADADLDALANHNVRVIAAPHTLRFEHHAGAHGRSLRAPIGSGRTLTAADLPRGWDRARLVILAPLLPRDLDLASFATLRAPRGRALLAQGLQRRRDATGGIAHLRHPAGALMRSLTAGTSVFLSSEEVARWSPGELRTVAQGCGRLVITEGALGAQVLHADGGALRVAPRRTTRVLDATGAGDVFAAAFILAIEQGAGEAAAGRIASALAAAKLRRRGPARLPAPRKESVSR